MIHMGLDPLKIDSVVLSHGHSDHTGGLAGFLRYQNAVSLYIPKSFPWRFKDEVGLTGARVKEVAGPMKIQADVHTTGELGGSMKEQSLVLKTTKGMIIVTGCAHPGIVEIVEQAVRICTDNVYLLIGGFHLMGRSPMEIRRMMEKLDALNVERIAPCHCSGDTAKELFMNHYQEKYIACGVGLFLKIPAVGSSFTPLQTA